MNNNNILEYLMTRPKSLAEFIPILHCMCEDRYNILELIKLTDDKEILLDKLFKYEIKYKNTIVNGAKIFIYLETLCSGNEILISLPPYPVKNSILKKMASNLIYIKQKIDGSKNWCIIKKNESLLSLSLSYSGTSCEDKPSIYRTLKDIICDRQPLNK